MKTSRPILTVLLALASSLSPGAGYGLTMVPRTQTGQAGPQVQPARPAASALPRPGQPNGQPVPAPPRPLAPGTGVQAGPPGAFPKHLLPGVGVLAGAPQAPVPKTAPPDRVHIYSDKAIYRRQEKRAEAIGHVKIIQDNTTIFADRVLYNEATKQSVVEDGVKIVQINKTKDKGRTTTITAGKMTAFHEERRMLLREDVRMDRDAVPIPEPADVAQSKAEKRARTERALEKARSVITADQMEYFTRTEDANLDGKVVVLQKDKQLTGDKATIKGEKNGDMIIIDGHAKVNQINGNWLIQNKIIRPDPEDEEQQRFLHEKMLMDADKITLHRATDDMEAEGNVKITQKVGTKERVAVGKQATYSEKDQLAVLTGDVKIQRENGDWLTADKVLYHTDKEVFEAFSNSSKQVESIFTLYDDEHPQPKEPINPLPPDNNLDQHQPGQRLPAWLRNRQEPGRAPSQPASPQPKTGPTPKPTPKPGNQPTPPPSAKPGEKPGARPGPQPSPRPTASAPPKPPAISPPRLPAPTPTPVTGNFIIPADE